MIEFAERLRARTVVRQDAIVALVVVAVATVGVFIDWGESDSSPSALDVVVAVLASATVWARRRFPIGVLLVVAATHLFIRWDIDNEVALLPAMAVALFAVARHVDRSVGLPVAALVGLSSAAGAAVIDADRFVPEFFGELAVMAVPIAIADAARSRADRLRSLIESEAARRVQAERLRIARDLHDVVAHGLSTIAIQSGVASHLLDRGHDRDMDQTKDALGVINATGKRSLEELRSMVGVLRSTDDAPLRPTPTDPNDLSDLLSGAADSGVEVALDVQGVFPAGVGDRCVVALHRIVQEALTNVARHSGAATASLRIVHRPDRVDVRIENTVVASPARTVDSTGVGIVGMRERAESLGGTLVASSTTSAGFEVTATLPYHLAEEQNR